MALTDINFQEGDGMDFIVELPDPGILNEPVDILVEESGSQFLLAEIPPAQGGGNVFIMSE
jgi:hypothetical protein